MNCVIIYKELEPPWIWFLTGQQRVLEQRDTVVSMWQDGEVVWPCNQFHQKQTMTG